MHWMHIQKTGSSLATVLAHYACGDHIPDDMAVSEPHRQSMHFRPAYGEDWRECGSWEAIACTERRWNFQCDKWAFKRFRGHHEPLGVDFEEDDLRHVATMFRDPLQRAVSGWKHKRHSCENSTNIGNYADCVKNCQTQMLSGLVCGSRGPVPSLEDYRRAEERLPQLGFIGLTNQWDLSVCLFHAMYGGVCKPIEFFNTRPGKSHTDSLYNLTEFGLTEGERVGYDDSLYAKAKELFWSRIENYNVTRQSCAELYCSPSKEFFEPKLDFSKRTKRTTSGMDYKFDWPGRPAYDED